MTVGDQAVTMWRAIEATGVQPSVSMVLRVLRELGLRFSNDVVRDALRTLSTEAPHPLARVPSARRISTDGVPSARPHAGAPADLNGLSLIPPPTPSVPSGVAAPPKGRRAAPPPAEVDFGPDEGTVNALLAIEAEANKTLAITPNRRLRERLRLMGLREQHGLEAWRFGMGEAVGRDKGLAYAVAVMRSTAARTASQGAPSLFGSANGARAPSALFTDTGRPTHANENVAHTASRITRIRGTIEPKES